MGKKPKRCPEKCPKHSFILKPVHYSAYFSRELSATFCPSYVRHPSITPRFNKDRRHYTAGFVLPADKKRLTTNNDFYEKDHERYKIEICHEKSSLLIAKPKSRSYYCNVCKDDYQDYLEHINGAFHRKNITQNRFEGYINELCMDMQAENTLSQSQCEPLYTETSLPLSLESVDLKLSPTPTSVSEYSKQHSPLSCKPFQLLPEAENPILDQELAISPLKRYAEATEGPRQAGTLKPIILNAPPLSFLNL